MHGDLGKGYIMKVTSDQCVGQQSTNCRTTVGRLPADCRPTSRRLSTDCQPTVDRRVGGIVDGIGFFTFPRSVSANCEYLFREVSRAASLKEQIMFKDKSAPSSLTKQSTSQNHVRIFLSQTEETFLSSRLLSFGESRPCLRQAV